MNSNLRVLLAGESWVTHTIHIKGMDTFTQSGYGDGSGWLRSAVENGGGTFTHMPSHEALTKFPKSVDELSKYDVVILSDIGANTLLLHPDTAVDSKPTPNRLKVVEDYVKQGGGLVMIGGYMTFQGIQGMARYSGTPVEAALPVKISQVDDRVEVPEGFCPTVVKPIHEILDGLPEQFPMMLFHNDVELKDGARELLEKDGSVILAVWEYGLGRSAAFTPDVAPHGATPDFLNWDRFDEFWGNLFTWVANLQPVGKA